jgi:hypothetical protein
VNRNLDEAHLAMPDTDDDGDGNPVTWSGGPHPDRPDDAWEDDVTGEAVCAHCGQRGPTLGTIPHAADCSWVKMVASAT